MSRSSRVRLTDILASITQIERYVEGCAREEFMENALLQDAVLRRLEIIGEAVNGLDPSERARHASIPWSAIAGMRDKLIHDYHTVDLELVWEVLRTHLGPLRRAAVDLLAEPIQ